MARERDPKRDQAFEIWQKHNGNISNRQIAEIIGVDEKKVAVWKQRDKWSVQQKDGVVQQNDNVVQQTPKNVVQQKKLGAPKGNKNAAGHGAPQGNKNAVGNRGGPGGPVGNKKAVTTGEYETIWFDTLTEDEQALINAIDMDTLAQVVEDIRLITIRERRMMKRIKDLVEGLSEKQRTVLQKLRTTKEPVFIHDAKSGLPKQVMVPKPEMVVASIEEVEYRKIEDILNLEEALTRVQDKKTRLLGLKHNIEMANRNLERQQLELEKLRAEIAKLNSDDGEDDDGTDNFKEALMGKVPEVWGDGTQN